MNDRSEFRLKMRRSADDDVDLRYADLRPRYRTAATFLLLFNADVRRNTFAAAVSHRTLHSHFLTQKNNY